MGPLNDAAVVRLVAEHCVPVALNANRIPNDDAGRFFQAIMRQSRWPQGIWIASPEGKVLYEYTSLSPDKHVENTLGAVKAWADAHPKQ